MLQKIQMLGRNNSKLEDGTAAGRKWVVKLLHLSKLASLLQPGIRLLEGSQNANATECAKNPKLPSAEFQKPFLPAIKTRSKPNVPARTHTWATAAKGKCALGDANSSGSSSFRFAVVGLLCRQIACRLLLVLLLVLGSNTSRHKRGGGIQYHKDTFPLLVKASLAARDKTTLKTASKLVIDAILHSLEMTN
uniref:Uncharacterized protein n=1 Tax=Anopheles coluzzii TaxID=1518534 RepID=A0A8W7Q033_ANOCL